jgi:hypothetical protein
MRKLTIFIVALGLVLSACAAPGADVPSVATEAPVVAAEPQPVSATETAPIEQPNSQPDAQPEAEEPQPQPTSRGDALMATDPALVNLGTGKPVLVEFFRFT